MALGVPVVAPDQAGFDAQQVVSAAVLDAADKGPLPVEFFCGAADGSLSIVGHNDDVADDAYNQTLSEKREYSVRQRLGELTDLSKW